MHLFLFTSFQTEWMQLQMVIIYISLTIFSSWLEIKLGIWEQEGIQDHFILTE